MNLIELVKMAYSNPDKYATIAANAVKAAGFTIDEIMMELDENLVE